jgi:DNA-directed RNA polymerase subunit RPC12/RpoP
VADRPSPDPLYDVVCPHCSKSFSAELLNGPTERHQGFKCPHCKLFVPLQRAEEQQVAEQAE